MAFPTHIVSAGGIVEDGKGNILLVKAHDDGWVFPGGCNRCSYEGDV